MNVGKFTKSGTDHRTRDPRLGGVREAVQKAYKRRFGSEALKGVWPHRGRPAKSK